MFVASLLFIFKRAPSQVYFGAAKRVLYYLQSIMNYGIMYKIDEDLKLIGYSNSDWVRCVDDMKSTSCYAFISGSSFVLGCQKSKILLLNLLPKHNTSWSLRLLLKLISLGKFLKILMKKQKGGTFWYCNNKSAIAIAKNSVNHKWSMYIFIEYHFIGEVQ